jgi:hypothetical protein
MLWLSPFWWLAMVPALRHSGRRTFAVAAVLLLASMLTTQWSSAAALETVVAVRAAGGRRADQLPHPATTFDPPRYSLLPQLPPAGTRQTFVSSRGDHVTLESGSEPGTGKVQVQPLRPACRASHCCRPPNFLKACRCRVPASRPAACSRHPTARPAAPLPACNSPCERIFGRLDSGRPYASAGTTWIPARSNPDTAWKTERGAVRAL